MTQYGVTITRWQQWRIRRWTRRGREARAQRYILNIINRQRGDAQP